MPPWLVNNVIIGLTIIKLEWFATFLRCFTDIVLAWCFTWNLPIQQQAQLELEVQRDAAINLWQGCLQTCSFTSWDFLRRNIFCDLSSSSSSFFFFFFFPPLSSSQSWQRGSGIIWWPCGGVESVAGLIMFCFCTKCVSITIITKDQFTSELNLMATTISTAHVANTGSTEDMKINSAGREAIVNFYSTTTTTILPLSVPSTQLDRQMDDADDLFVSS